MIIMKDLDYDEIHVYEEHQIDKDNRVVFYKQKHVTQSPFIVKVVSKGHNLFRRYVNKEQAESIFKYECEIMGC